MWQVVPEARFTKFCGKGKANLLKIVVLASRDLQSQRRQLKRRRRFMTSTVGRPGIASFMAMEIVIGRPE
jgi:hypothetical protein